MNDSIANCKSQIANPPRPTVRIRSADDPTLWVSDVFKNERGHEFHYMTREEYAARFDATDAQMIVDHENARRITGKLEIVHDGPLTTDAGNARSKEFR